MNIVIKQCDPCIDASGFVVNTTHAAALAPKVTIASAAILLTGLSRQYVLLFQN